MISPPGQGAGEEKRRSIRKRVLLNGMLAYDGGAFTVGCTIRDISETGARVSLPKGQFIPAHTYLLHMRNRIAYEAVKVWSRHPDVGLKFKRTYVLSEPLPPHLQFLPKLWIQSVR